MSKHFDWVELTARPLKDGLHESGYRFLRTTGGHHNADSVEMHEWADHAVFYGGVNIDVTRDGTFRVMPRGSTAWEEPDYLYASDAEFYPTDMDGAIKYLDFYRDVVRR